MANQPKEDPKAIKATGQMKKIMYDYFQALDKATKDPQGKVAWCTSVGPGELLLSFGFKVYYPENHGALLGAMRLANKYIPTANAIGYSPDICSYLTSDVGAYICGETPLKQAFNIDLPKPDVIAFNTNQCRDVQDWMSFYSREFGVPSIGLHTPRGAMKVEDYQVDALANQLESLIPDLEKISGQKFDMDRFKAVLQSSLNTTLLWKKVLRTAASIPSPLTFFDGTIHMGPAVVLRGEQPAEDYYELLLSELEDKVNKGIAAVEDETFRVYWDGMPIWGKLRSMSNLFAGLKTCVVASTYCNSWIFDAFDPADPFRSMARAYTELFIVRADEEKEKYIKKMHEIYKFDGIIYHDAKTCPNNSNNRYGMPQRLQKKLGIPYIVINGDLNDLRCFSEEQTNTNVEAFIEQLSESR
ncbi:2-hydroxyacyl-CoA dehydratase family protein [bacterium]|nr:2-hydroxyacyl-CoA dehydratase family protein [bacterium]